MELWFHRGNDSLSYNCRKTANEMMPDNLEVASIDNLEEDSFGNITKPSDPFVLNIELVDPEGNIRCIHKEKVVFNQDIYPINGLRHEKAYFVEMKCGPLDPGVWTIRVKRSNTIKPPFVYELKMFHLPHTEKEFGSLAFDTKDIDLLRGFWKLENVVFLPLTSPYNSMNIRKKIVKGNTSLFSSLENWFLCHGGLFSSLICAIFGFQWFKLILTYDINLQQFYKHYINNGKDSNTRIILSSFKVKAICKSLIIITMVACFQCSVYSIYCCN